MFVGETELKSEVFTLKDIVTGSEKKLSLERVVSAVKDRRIKRSSEDEEFDIDIAG